MVKNLFEWISEKDMMKKEDWEHIRGMTNKKIQLNRFTGDCYFPEYFFARAILDLDERVRKLEEKNTR